MTDNSLFTYNPQWHEEGAGLLRSLYNRIPVNARLMVEYGLGRTAPITERDFAPSDLQAIKRQATAQRMALGEQYARNRSAQESMNPLNAAMYDPVAAMSGESPQNIFARRSQELAQQVADYERRRELGRTPVMKYEPAAGQIDEQSWGNVLQGLSNPDMRIGTSLGRYTVVETPRGQMAVDRYDFNRYGSEHDEPFSWDMVTHPVKGADWFMRKYSTTPPIPVQIMLPK